MMPALLKNVFILRYRYLIVFIATL